MKKLFLSATFLFAVVFAVEAQNISKNALGLRLGDNDGFGGEISYQRKLSGDNRLELDLGFRNSKYYDALKLAAIYQWTWKIDNGFYWYAGVGGGLGTWKNNFYKGDYKTYDSGTILFVAGDLGIEYNFDVPIQLALDIRPELYFNSDKYRTDNFGPDLALSIRYRFN